MGTGCPCPRPASWTRAPPRSPLLPGLPVGSHRPRLRPRARGPRVPRAQPGLPARARRGAPSSPSSCSTRCRPFTCPPSQRPSTRQQAGPHGDFLFEMDAVVGALLDTLRSWISPRTRSWSSPATTGPRSRRSSTCDRTMTTTAPAPGAGSSAISGRAATASPSSRAGPSGSRLAPCPRSRSASRTPRHVCAVGGASLPSAAAEDSFDMSAVLLGSPRPEACAPSSSTRPGRTASPCARPLEVPRPRGLGEPLRPRAAAGLRTGRWSPRRQGPALRPRGRPGDAEPRPRASGDRRSPEGHARCDGRHRAQRTGAVRARRQGRAVGADPPDPRVRKRARQPRTARPAAPDPRDAAEGPRTSWRVKPT